MSQSQQILIIEDDSAIAGALEIKLQKEGMEVKVVNNGFEGIKELKKGGYDLALVDLIMPYTDGWAVLQMVKDENIKTKIIITSNLSQEEDIVKAKEMGAVDYLVKSNSSLAAIVEKVKKVV